MFMPAFMVMIDVTVVVRVGLLVNIHSAGFMYEVEIDVMDASVFIKRSLYVDNSASFW